MAMASAAPATAPRLRFAAVTPARWPDFERLFDARGGPKNCWCMVWRSTPEEARDTSSAHRKKTMAERIHAGTPVGLLAYLKDEPVAWCSVAPRPTYRRLVSKADDPDNPLVWSITCFFIRRDLRRSGVTRQLIQAAIKHARAHGARVLEAYPVDADSPSYRFMGFVPVFEAAGFIEIGVEGKRRHVMQRKLAKARKPKPKTQPHAH
jgi:GNAT superfamily N-acetyltransferase